MALLTATLTTGAKHAAYVSAQAARILWYTGHYAAGRRLMGPLTEPGEAPYAEEFAPLDRQRLKDAFRSAFRQDWKNIEAGRYRMPAELRRLPSLPNLLKQSRDYLRDSKKIARRKHARGHSEVLTETSAAKYPRYFLQNFHYQTDGWLTAASAERYDMQVETLFTGAAGPMRRASLPLIGDALRGKDVATAALLDIGCGGGRYLQGVKENWPQLSVTALDLSPAYLGKARARLGRWNDVRYIEANAEATGLEGGAYDVVTAVYLFHELPPLVRAIVAAEIADC